MITNPSWCADSLAAMAVAEALGARVERRADLLTVSGPIEADTPLGVSCGESGLCLRMFSAIASLSSAAIELRGEGSLRARPVGPIEAPLAELGVRCVTNAGMQPVSVQGPLRPGVVTVDGSASSQFITGLLLALPMSGGDSVVHVRNPASVGYLDLTIDVMRSFGAAVERDADYRRFVVAGRPYVAGSYEVEGDWSGAAFLLVAGAIAAGPEGLVVTGLSARSAQPDRAILQALDMAGARCDARADGYHLRSGPLRAFSFDATDCPDLVPPLVALASRCAGVSTIRGASRLRAKESDRAAALSQEFAALGLGVEVDGDVMVIRGPDRPLAGGTVRAHGDHRIAMAAAIAALAASASVTIDGAECVAKSWPEFFEVLSSIGR